MAGFNQNPFVSPLFKLFGKKLANVPPSPTNLDIIQFNSTSGEWELINGVIGSAVQSSSNVGTGFGLALARVLDDLPFKSLVQNAEVLITSSATELAFSIGAIAQSKITGLVALLATKIDTVVNVGTGVGKVFRDKIGTTINLKSIKAGVGITVTNNADDIEISSTATGAPSILLHNVNTEVATTSDDFFAFGGADPDSGVELNAENCFPISCKIQNITVQVSTQRDGISTVRSRKNNIDGNALISIPASTTGIFRDNVNSDNYDFLDTGDYKVNAVGSGTLTIVSLACEVVNQ